jgi:threonine dehydrogenase-like Zn-dependent dehydrogenase
VPGGQAELLRVPHADYGPIVVPDGPADDRFLFLSDVLPTAWQAVQYADIPKGGSLAVLGLGPIGDMCARVAKQLGVDRVIGVDLVPERLDRSRARGVDVVDLNEFDRDRDVVEAVRNVTDGRGPDAVIDAVGMEAHGSTAAHAAHKLTALMPNALSERLMLKAGVDRLAALNMAFELVRRGGTISVIGVYGGMTDPLPMMKLFDKQVAIRMGQANVRNWVDDILPLLTDDDPLGVESFATHHLPLEEASSAYAMFQEKRDGAIKVVFRPQSG